MRIGLAQLFSKQMSSLNTADKDKLMGWLLPEFLKTTLVPNEFIRRSLLPILYLTLQISIKHSLSGSGSEAGESVWKRFRKRFLAHMEKLVVDKGLGDRDYCELYRDECVLRSFRSVPFSFLIHSDYS